LRNGKSHLSGQFVLSWGRARGSFFGRKVFMNQGVKGVVFIGTFMVLTITLAILWIVAVQWLEMPVTWAISCFLWSVLGGFIGGVINGSKGYSPLVGYVAGFILGPCLVWLLVFDKPKASKNLRKCPYCAEKIKKEAKVCRYCGKPVEPDGDR
jgi:hypothetical protein